MFRQSKAAALLQLLRWPNLLIAALVQYIYHRYVLVSAFESQQIELSLTDPAILLILICTSTITASGNIINDLLDQKTDAINRPGRRIVGIRISEEVVYWIYFTHVIVGFAVAVLLAIQLEEKIYLWMFPVAVAMLWFYSRKLKIMPLAGNIFVALFCSLVIAIIWFTERDALKRLEIVDSVLYNNISNFSLYYMGLAFLTTFFRELVKDAEDLRGDKAHGAKTFPVVAGLKATKILAGSTGFIAAMVLLLAGAHLWPIFRSMHFLIISGGILIPGIAAGYYLYRAEIPEDFSLLSRFAKWIMLAGLLLPLALNIN
jgi:4-hydroxybenzoate polyprenyltransferase